MPTTDQDSSFLLCVKNDGFAASLEVRKVYQTISDPVATSRGFVRFVDESGEDYLYPAGFFVPVELPQAAFAAFTQAS